jgi:Acyl-CoA reductase (LuxC)
MSNLIRTVDRPGEITAAAQQLRERALSSLVTPMQAIDVLERWGTSLHGSALEVIPGLAFLRLWLRRGSLEPILLRELGPSVLHGEWRREAHARLGIFPLGVVGHWPAGNIEIQPLLSMSCSLLGGNACLVRVPTGLVETTRMVMERLQEIDTARTVTDRVLMTTFDHERMDLQQAMAAAVDGAMIWGGADSVSQIRALPFPHWARVAVFGPRLSIAAMDGESWDNETEQAAWCQRIARDVWQFDQQACSSPQALFLERREGCDIKRFVRTLRQAFDEENRVHPRHDIHPALSSAICLTRASWLLEDSAHHAVFPMTPDWTILLGAGSDIPTPTQGRTLSVLMVENLLDPISRFDGTVQTLGLAVRNVTREAILAQAAASNGVDRIVKLGRMHVFGSPWDGADLVRPMTRLVRHMPSHES